MTMLPDIDATSWLEYQRKRAEEEINARIGGFGLDRIVGEKIAGLQSLVGGLPEEEAPPVAPEVVAEPPAPSPAAVAEPVFPPAPPPEVFQPAPPAAMAEPAVAYPSVPPPSSPAPTPSAPPPPTPTPLLSGLGAAASAVGEARDRGLQIVGSGITDLARGGPGITNLAPIPAPVPVPPAAPPPAAPPTYQGAPAGPAAAPPAPAGSFQEYARQAARRYGVDPDIYMRQIQQESGFNPSARSPAGATGIAQFMPGTAQGMGIDPTDPYASLDAGARLMRQNLDRYQGDYATALAAYNAGPGAVAKYGGVPPFEETQRYVNVILGGVSAPGAPEGLTRAGAAIGEAGKPEWQRLAETQLGKPYIWGSAGGRSDFRSEAAGFDCSGFVSYVYKNALGIDLPAQTASAYAATKPIKLPEAQPGDVVLYNMDNPDPHVQHIAIYLGDGKVIQSGGTARNVNIDNIAGAGSYEIRRADGAQTALTNQKASTQVADDLHPFTPPPEGADPRSTIEHARQMLTQPQGLQVVQSVADEEPTLQIAQAESSSPIDRLKSAFGDFVESISGAGAPNPTPAAVPGGGYDPSHMGPGVAPAPDVPLRQDVRDLGLGQAGQSGVGSLFDQLGTTVSQGIGAPQMQAELDVGRERAERERLERQTTGAPYDLSETLGQEALRSGAERAAAPGQLYGADVAAGQALSGAVVDKAKEAGWTPDPGQERFVRNTLAQVTPANVLLSVLTSGQSTLARTLAVGAAELAGGAVGSELALEKAREAGWPEWAQTVAQLGGGLGGGIGGGLGSRGALRAADSPAVQAAIRSGLPAEAEAGFAAGMPTGGRTAADNGFARAYDVPSNAGTKTMLEAPPPKTETETSSMNRFVRAWTNRSEGVDRFTEDALRQGGHDPKRPTENLHLKAMIRQMNTDGAVKLAEDRYIKPALAAVGKFGEEGRRVLSSYLIHRNNIDIAQAAGRTYRNFPGGGTLIESQKALREMQEAMSPEEWKTLGGAADMIYELVGHSRKRMLDTGLIDQREFNMWNGQSPHYVPTRILDHLDEGGGPRVGSKFSLSDNGVRALSDEGTIRFREDPLASVLGMVAQVESKARKNEAVRTILDLDAMGNKAITPTDRPVTTGENVIQYIRNGVVERHVAPPDLAAVINSASIEHAPGFTKSWVDFQRNVMTVLNPAFALIRNPTLDVPTYLTRQYAREGGDMKQLPRIVSAMFDGYRDGFKGFWQNEYGGAGTQRYLEGGGSGSTLVSSAERRAQQIEKLSGSGIELGSAADVAGTVRKLLDLLPRAAERMDLGPRVAAMKMAEARGAGPRQAVQEGRNVTIDFNEGGELAKTLNSFVPFFNVGPQDAAQIARMFRENPQGATAAMVMLVGLPQLAAEAWNRADAQRSKDYDDVPNYIKRQGPLVMLPDWMTPGGTPVDKDGNRRPQYWQVNFGARAAFSTIAREAANVAMQASGAYNEETGRGPATPEEWQTLLSDIFWQAAPVKAGGVGEAARNLLPEFLPGQNTAVQLGMNQNLFTGSQIATERTDREATQAAREVSGALTNAVRLIDPKHEIRPSQLEFALKDVLGGWGDIALGTAGGVRQFLPGAEPQESTEPQKIPVLGGALRAAGVRGDIGETGRRARENVLTRSAREYLQHEGVEYVPDPVAGSFQDVPLRRDEQTRYQQLANRYVDNEIQQMRQDSELAGLRADEKLEIVQERIATAREQALAEVISAIPDADWNRRFEKMINDKEKEAVKTR